jgi:dienelactone hydrolase
MRAWWRLVAERIMSKAAHSLMYSGDMTYEDIPPALQARFRFAGVPEDVVRSALATINGGQKWDAAWELEGERAEAAGAHELAFCCYFAAQRMMTEPTPRKLELYRHAVRNFERREVPAPLERPEVYSCGNRVGVYLQVPEGDGPRPLVLAFTGIGGTKEEIFSQADSLVRAGYAVASIDLHGYGETEGHASPATMSMGADVWRALREDPRLDAEHPHLYGFCLGGLYATWAAPSVSPRSLTLISSPLEPHRASPRFEPVVRAQVLQATGPVGMANWWEFQRMGLVRMISAWPVAHHVTAPTFLYYGGRDPLVRRADMESIANRVRGPVFQTYYPDQGHCCIPLLDEIIEELVTHYRELDAAAEDPPPATGTAELPRAA